MKKTTGHYEPHLTLRELVIPPSGEWSPRPVGWTVVWVREGNGYFLQPQANRELMAGHLLLLAAPIAGVIRASQLGGLSLCLFSVIPARLTGLITLSEHDLLDVTVQKDFPPQIFPPDSPVAAKMGGLCATQKQTGLLFRTQLLQVFIESFGKELAPLPVKNDASDARERLQTLLEQMPASDLMELDFHGLAQMTRCTSRHLSRIFYQLTGMSFRDKRAELRLGRARELLATSNAKVVEVALESGYKSLSLFNLMFARRFGTSPSKWRQKQESQKGKDTPENSRPRTVAPGINHANGFKLNPPKRRSI